MDMRRLIEEKVSSFVKEFQGRENIQTEFGEPIVGFADTYGPEIQGLRQVIGESHVLPQQVLADAKSVLAYYVPFTEKLAALEFDQHELVSNWSHRHMAYAAGLGTFGINNMLITRMGCCGRFNSIVTNLEMDFDEPMNEELCLYKVDGSCGACISKCPAGALNPKVSDKFGAGFARAKCYEVCLENADKYPVPQELAPSYSAVGSEVCGKCVTGSPCAFRKSEAAANKNENTLRKAEKTVEINCALC